MIYLYLFGTCFHFIYVFMIIGNKRMNCPNGQLFTNPLAVIQNKQMYGKV